MIPTDVRYMGEIVKGVYELITLRKYAEVQAGR